MSYQQDLDKLDALTRKHLGISKDQFLKKLNSGWYSYGDGRNDEMAQRIKKAWLEDRSK